MYLYLLARLHLAMLLIRELGIGKRKLVLCSSVHSFHQAMCDMQLTTYRFNLCVVSYHVPVSDGAITSAMLLMMELGISAFYVTSKLFESSL